MTVQKVERRLCIHLYQIIVVLSLFLLNRKTTHGFVVVNILPSPSSSLLVAASADTTIITTIQNIHSNSAAATPKGREEPLNLLRGRNTNDDDDSCFLQKARNRNENDSASLLIRRTTCTAITMLALASSFVFDAATAAAASSSAAMPASPIAAKVNINAIPPSAVIVQDDLPVIGQYISGTYARVDTQAVVAVGNALGGGRDENGGTDDVSKKISRKFQQPSVMIKSPSDKVAAIKELASNGHLEFDIDGVVTTHLDVDIASSKPGELTVKLTSPIIPVLPFKR